MKNVIIAVDHISKTFIAQSNRRQKIKALDDVSLDVHQGEILGILGPNGAGKTTLLNILATLLLPDQGSVAMLGLPLVEKNFPCLRRHFNMSSGSPNLPWSLTVEEILRFYGRLYGFSGQALIQRIEELIAMLELQSFRRRRFDELSSGSKQRLALAKALLNHPKIIFLDEPTVGLDPDVAIRVRQMIKHVIEKTQATVLFTTHNMQEAEQLCQRIAFIKSGKILQVASPSELKRMLGKNDLEEVFLELTRMQNLQSQTENKRVGREARSIESMPPLLPNLAVEEKIFSWMNRCFGFAYRNFLFAVRNFFAFAELIFWPVVSLISIGLLGDFAQLQNQAVAFILTGAITAGVLQVAQLDVAYGLLYEVWSKSVKHTFLTPVGMTEHLFGSWLIGVGRGVVIFFILGYAAVIFFDFPMPSVTATWIFLAGIFACSFLLGLLVNVLIMLFGQKAEITAWMFAYLFMLISGIYYPIDTLPPIFVHAAQWVPITYFLEFYRQSFGFSPILQDGLVKGFALILVYFAVGKILLFAAVRQARKKGIIVRLSE